jgi:hypothetical protein
MKNKKFLNITVVHSILVGKRMLLKQDRNRLDSCTRKQTQKKEIEKTISKWEKMETTWHSGLRKRRVLRGVFSYGIIT